MYSPHRVFDGEVLLIPSGVTSTCPSDKETRTTCKPFDNSVLIASPGQIPGRRKRQRVSGSGFGKSQKPFEPLPVSATAAWTSWSNGSEHSHESEGHDEGFVSPWMDQRAGRK